jgi:hypothetical protein
MILCQRLLMSMSFLVAQAAARPMNPMMIVNPMAGMYGQMPMQQQQYPYQQSYMQQPQYQQQQQPQQQQQQASSTSSATGEYDPNVYAQWFIPPAPRMRTLPPAL